MWPRRITQERSLSLRKDFLGKKRVSNILSHYDGLMVLFVRIAGVQKLGECLGGFGSVVNVESKSRFLRGLFFKTRTCRFKPGLELCGIFAVRRME
jgi:hypothetical protein